MLKENRISVASTIAPAARTANVTGDGVDLAGNEAATVVFDVGAVANNDWTFAIQASDDDGDSDAYAPVAAADLDGTIPDAPDATTVTLVHYRGRKRWLRVVATDGGTGDASFGVAVVLGAPRRL